MDTHAICLAAEPSCRVGALSIRPNRREIVDDDGHRQVLQPRVMQVLVALIRAQGETVGRDALIQQCWGGRIVGEDAIDRVIAALRRVAAGPSRRLFRIETIPRVGYRLVVDPAVPQPRPVRRAPSPDGGRLTTALAIGVATMLCLALASSA